MSGLDFPSTDGVNNQRREWLYNQIIKYRPDLLNSPDLLYGDLELIYIRFLNDGTIPEAVRKDYVDTQTGLKLDKVASALPTGQDMNNALTAGNFNVQSSSQWVGALNWPILSSGMYSIISRSGNDTVTQKFDVHNSRAGVFYDRNLYGGTWSPWVKFSAETMLNALEFCTGDGVTDDGTGIQNAVNAAIAQNKELFWPYGTYLKTVNITNLHTVRHRGPGAIKHGTDIFYVEPKLLNANKLYVATSSASDTFDGINPAFAFRKVGKAVNTLDNYGPILQGFWTIQLGAGTWSDRTVVTPGLDAVNTITVQGPIVNHPNIPTAIISEGYNIGAVGIKLSNVSASFTFSNLLLSGYNGTTSSAGIQQATTQKTCYYINCHFQDCYWGISNQTGIADVKGGIFQWNGYLGSGASRVTNKALRSGNGGGYRGLMHSRHSIGLQSAGDNTNGPFFYNNVAGVFVQESCTGHVDWAVFEDNDFVFNTNVNSRVNSDGCSFKRNRMVYRGLGGCHFYVSNNTFGTGVDENGIIFSLEQGTQITDNNTVFTNIEQSYNIVTRIVDTVFPAQTVQTTSSTVVYTATLNKDVWRDAIDSTHTRKRLLLKVYGELFGTAGTKTIMVRFGTSNISATFTATEVGTFEAEAVIYFTDKATQYMRLSAQRHLGTSTRLSKASGTNTLTAATNATVEASVGVATDSILIDAVELAWG